MRAQSAVAATSLGRRVREVVGGCARSRRARVAGAGDKRSLSAEVFGFENLWIMCWQRGWPTGRGLTKDPQQSHPGGKWVPNGELASCTIL